MADGVFQQMVNDAGLADAIHVDSCGTGGWHKGERAHRGSRAVLEAHDIPYNGRSRQVTAKDMADDNTWVIAMDASNMRDLKSRFGEHPRLYRLLEFSEKYEDVADGPDPYYSGGFDYVYELVVDGCEGLLKHVQTHL